MADKLLSELAKGAWSGATAYTVGDIVDNDGSSYICILNGTNHEPPNATYWALLASIGATGATGPTGETGPQGIPGTGEIVGGVENNIVSIDANEMIEDSGKALPTGAVVGTTDTQTLTNKELTSPKVGTSINDTNGNEIIKTPATASAVNELTVTNSATTAPIILSATGGDTNIGVEINPKGTGVIQAKTTVQLTAFSPTADTATGDGKVGLRIPAELDGMNLVAVAACVTTAGTTGTTDVQIRRVRSATPADMLSTKITIDSTEVDTSTAATAAVINGTNDDVATGDQIYIDVDAVSTTKAKGLFVHMTFANP
jgi:hypothetical protein